MATQGVLKEAHAQFKKRKFTKVISLLEPNVINYRNSFDCFYLLGVSCMYIGDIGGAHSYLQRARQLKIRDPRVLLAQAALYLRKCEVNQAVEYYLETLDYEPGNKIAKEALEFIRKKNDPDIIMQWIDTGKITRFYPDTGINTHKIILISSGIATFFVVFSLISYMITGNINPLPNKNRADLSDFSLSGIEKKAAIEIGGTYHYTLTEAEVIKTYNTAQSYFNKYMDNSARVEINRILNSNASINIRQKARFLLDYMDDPDFNSIKDNFSYAQVVENPHLYQDCWVVWSGRVSNIVKTATNIHCNLLIGYENLSKIEGTIPVELDTSVIIDSEKPIKILGQLGFQDNKLYLKARTVHQSLLPDGRK